MSFLFCSEICALQVVASLNCYWNMCPCWSFCHSPHGYAIFLIFGRFIHSFAAPLYCSTCQNHQIEPSKTADFWASYIGTFSQMKGKHAQMLRLDTHDSLPTRLVTVTVSAYIGNIVQSNPTKENCRLLPQLWLNLLQWICINASSNSASSFLWPQALFKHTRQLMFPYRSTFLLLVLFRKLGTSQ